MSKISSDILSVNVQQAAVSNRPNMTYDEVSSLIGAGKESRWMSVHLVLKSGRSAIFCLSTECIPEVICEQDGRISSNYYLYL